MQVKTIFLAAFVCLHFWAAAQQNIALSDCLEAARSHQPIARQSELIAAAHREAMTILQKNNLPQIALAGQATWQTEVTELPIKINLPGFEVPTLSKDQYKLTLEIVHALWDGGQNRGQKDLQTTQTALEQAKLQTDLYATRELVLQLFCAAVLAGKQSEILAASQLDLKNRKNRLEEQVKNGTAIPSNIQSVEVRMLELEQQNEEIESKKRAALDGLELLTGLKISENDKLQLPATAGFQISTTVERPEISLFDLQKQLTGAQSKLTGTKSKPRINAIGTLGYGRPGLNFLKNEFEPYAVVGLNFRWNLSNFYTKSVSHEQQQLAIQGEKTVAQRDQFLMQTNVRQQNQIREIERLGRVMEKDKTILNLREKIVATAAVQVENGVLTQTEFLTETTLETTARLNAALHEIQLAQARLMLDFVNGKL